MTRWPRSTRLILSGVVALVGLLTVRTAAQAPGETAVAPEAPPALALTPARAEAFLRAFEEGLDHVPGEVIVKFREGTLPAAMSRALSVARGPVPDAGLQWVGDALLVRVPEEPDVRQLVERLVAQPEVEWAEPNGLLTPQAAPTDPFYRTQWHFDQVNMPAAWDINPGGSPNVTVAVVDTGITTRTVNYTWTLWDGRALREFPVPYAFSPDFSASQVLAGRDYVFFTAGAPVLDMDGHGTHVAGTILQATNNGVGVAGMAYRSTLLPLKACTGYWELQIVWGATGRTGFVPPTYTGGCDTASTTAAVRYAADQGAKVINISLGGTSPSQLWQDALNYAVQRGAFVAMAAGNNYDRGNATSYPALYARDLQGAMAVGAVGPDKRRSYYSNTGTYVEIAAPGGDFRTNSTGGVYQVTLLPSAYDPALVAVPRFDQYAVVGYQGTSMATPHVAGLAALLYAQGITNPAAVEAAITRFAVDLGPAGRDNEYGAGLIDARATLRGLGVAR